MSWPTRNTIPMNSLFYDCIQQTPNYFNQKHQNQATSITDCRLPLQIRQQILDYFVRERIKINADLICELLSNEGISQFDLWSLCEINFYNDDDVLKILNQLTANCHNIFELNIGGPEWIYNNQLINGPLMKLFCDGDLKKLRKLKFQQLNNDKMLNQILNNCKNLIKLEIREPSITDQHLQKIANQTSDQTFELEELTLPSSVRNQGLFDCFRMFKKLRSLSISNIEPILDYLDDDYDEQNKKIFNLKTNQQYINQLINQLKQLNRLTITNPMGQYAVEQIVQYCPNLNELNLEVQEIMHLKSICKLSSLKSLSLHNSPNLPTSFLAEVQPILESIGRQFVSLSLEQFDVLDLVEINKLCPVLHSFSAQWFTLLSVGRSHRFRLFNESMNQIQFAMASTARNLDNFTRSSNQNKMKNDFSNLRLLRLRPRLNRKLSCLAIEYIIRNAKHLQYLELYCCDNQLNDKLFEHWFGLNNGFKELKYLIIRHCNELNRKTIAELFKKSRSNSLMYLELDEPILNKTELVPNSDDQIDLNIQL